MARPTYKFSEFVDLLLVKLYDLDQDRGGEGFFDLGIIAKEIKGDVPSDWLFDAAKILQTRALADCIFTFGGTHAKISGEGRLYVEEGRGITKKAQETPASFFVNVTGNNNQVVAGHNAADVHQHAAGSNGDSPLIKILNEIEQTVQSDSTLPDERRKEAITYTNLIRHEAEKPEPNRNLLGAVLEPLSKIASIAGNVASLIKLFNASL